MTDKRKENDSIVPDVVEGTLDIATGGDYQLGDILGDAGDVLSDVAEGIGDVLGSIVDGLG